ncbi:MAG: ABC transporter ATP-binding protein [Treponema sp.]|nr:ABC transporter ATP-binding protein [Treponema sp.]
MATVRLEHINKKFGKTEVIHDLSFETRDGEFSFILGPSGAGKTTILSLIAGILPMNGGSIYINNKLVNRLKPKDRNVAIAFESYALYPNRTVYGNIRFPLDAPIRKKDMTEEEKDKRIHEIARLLQIDDLLQRYPKELSGGQRQRVALGRTLIRKPSLYLLDEPIAHLDAKLRHQMRGELKRLQRELGIPVICASPDQSEAVAMADRIFVLNRGGLEQEGTADELYFHPASEFAALMLGEPKMSLIPVELEKSGDALYVFNKDIRFRAIKNLELLAGQRELPRSIDLGLRPTDIQVSFSEKEGFHQFTVDFFQINGERLVISTVRGDTKIVVALEYRSGVMVTLGQSIWLAWESGNVYAFDPVSKKSVLC